MKSKKALFSFLNDRFNTNITLDDVENETYGKDSRIYLWNVKKLFNNKTNRRKLEKELIDNGFKVHTSYWPEMDIIEVSVSYFKGYHWNI